MRLFVAVNLPDEEKAKLAQATLPLRTGLPFRWLLPEAVHLTLKFLGEVAEPRSRAVIEAVENTAARHAPFSLELGGVGAFPSLRRPRVLWVGVMASSVLSALQADVERALARSGFPTEDRPFSPHITVARAWNDAKPAAFQELEQLARSVVYAGIAPVKSVDLMRSHLGRAGARYERIAAAPLRLASAPTPVARASRDSGRDEAGTDGEQDH